MRRTELIAAGVIFLLGAHVVQQSTELQYWEKYGPGPGFLPFWVGISFMVFSVLHATNIVIQPRLYQGPQPFPTGGSALRVVALAGILVVSVFLIGILGFATSLVLLVAACLIGIERLRWWKAAAASIAVAAVCYLLFAVVVGVVFPAGPLGI